VTTLYERLLGQADNIPVDTYVSVISEQRRGNVTASEITTLFSYTGAQANDHADILARMQEILTPLGAAELRDTLILAEAQFKYTSEELLKARLGIS